MSLDHYHWGSSSHCSFSPNASTSCRAYRSIPPHAIRPITILTDEPTLNFQTADFVIRSKQHIFSTSQEFWFEELVVAPNLKLSSSPICCWPGLDWTICYRSPLIILSYPSFSSTLFLCRVVDEQVQGRSATHRRAGNV